MSFKSHENAQCIWLRDVAEVTMQGTKPCSRIETEASGFVDRRAGAVWVPVVRWLVRRS